MNIPATSLKEFKIIYENETGQKISDREALEMAESLLNVFQHVYKPIPKQTISNQLK